MIKKINLLVLTLIVVFSCNDDDSLTNQLGGTGNSGNGQIESYNATINNVETIFDTGSYTFSSSESGGDVYLITLTDTNNSKLEIFTEPSPTPITGSDVASNARLEIDDKIYTLNNFNSTIGEAAFISLNVDENNSERIVGSFEALLKFSENDVVRITDGNFFIIK